MEAVGNLHRLWCPLPNAGCIRFRAVTGHHVDLGMHLEPVRHRVGQAVLQHVNGAAALQIDHDGAVVVAFAPGPIVDANDMRRWIGWRGQTSHPPEHGVTTARQSLPGQLPGTGSAPEGQAGRRLAVAQPRRGTGIQRCHGRQALREGDAPTHGGVTKEAAHMQHKLDGHQGPGQIGEGARVATMHPMGGLVTIGADGLGGGHRGHEGEVVVLQDEGFKMQVVIGGKQARAQIVQRHRCSPLGAGGSTVS